MFPVFLSLLSCSTLPFPGLVHKKTIGSHDAQSWVKYSGWTLPCTENALLLLQEIVLSHYASSRHCVQTWVCLLFATTWSCCLLFCWWTATVTSTSSLAPTALHPTSFFQTVSLVFQIPVKCKASSQAPPSSSPHFSWIFNEHNPYSSIHTIN